MMEYEFRFLESPNAIGSTLQYRGRRMAPEIFGPAGKPNHWSEWKDVPIVWATRNSTPDDRENQT